MNKRNEHTKRIEPEFSIENNPRRDANLIRVGITRWNTSSLNTY